jgi:hypothetical protein
MVKKLLKSKVGKRQQNQHTFGQIHNIMQILQTQKKAVEKLYIHKVAAKDNHLNDEHSYEQ